MNGLADGDKIGRVAKLYRDIFAKGDRGYDPRKILLHSDYFDLPPPASADQVSIEKVIAKLGEYVASTFNEEQKVELISQIKELLSEEVIKDDRARLAFACSLAILQVGDYLYDLSLVDCYEFLRSLETLLTREEDPKFQPTEIYIFGPFAGARPPLRSNLNIAIVSDAFAQMNLGERKSLIQQLTNNTARLAAIGITFEEAENKYSLGDKELLCRSSSWPGHAAQWELFPARNTSVSNV